MPAFSFYIIEFRGRFHKLCRSFPPNAQPLRYKKASQKLGIERKQFGVGCKTVHEIESRHDNSILFQHAEEIRRRSMILKVPKNSMMKGSAKRRRAGTVEHCDYLTNKNYRPAKRRRTDPLITLGSILDKVCGV